MRELLQLVHLKVLKSFFPCFSPSRRRVAFFKIEFESTRLYYVKKRSEYFSSLSSNSLSPCNRVVISIGTKKEKSWLCQIFISTGSTRSWRRSETFHGCTVRQDIGCVPNRLLTYYIVAETHAVSDAAMATGGADHKGTVVSNPKTDLQTV